MPTRSSGADFFLFVISGVLGFFVETAHVGGDFSDTFVVLGSIHGVDAVLHRQPSDGIEDEGEREEDDTDENATIVSHDLKGSTFEFGFHIFRTWSNVTITNQLF